MSLPRSAIVTPALHEMYMDEHSMVQMGMVVRHNNLGVACIESGAYERAGQYFRRALDKASETMFFSLPQSESYIKPGEVSRSLYIYQRGEYDEGMHTFSDPFFLDVAFSTMHSATATILFNIGQLHLRLDNNEEASASFLRALHIAQWSNEDILHDSEEGVCVMAILHNIGHVQYRSGNYEDAVRTYAKALHLAKKCFLQELTPNVGGCCYTELSRGSLLPPAKGGDREGHGAVR
jgi:tetratricopeptide (TPR) repeat protein